MSSENGTVAVLTTLVIYNAVLVAVGVWANRRNRDVTDFFLGGRQLGPWVSAISASASSSSAWTLLGVSGAAFAWGWPAVWLFPATLLGFVFNWYFVAPRLRQLSAAEGALTLSEVIAPASLGRARGPILKVCSVIIVFCFVFYVASQFEAAGKAFESVFGLSKQLSVIAGALIVLSYTLLGGFWAVSVTDSIQGVLMAVAALVLPVVALVAVGGPGEMMRALSVSGSTPFAAPGGVQLGFLSFVLFVLGTLGIGIGYPGQPHVVNRFMAIRDRAALRQARTIAVGWAVVVYAGMLTLGFCGRALYGDVTTDAEQILFTVATGLLPAVFAGIMLAAVLSAIMSTADSQLLVAASAISHDWSAADEHRTDSMRASRITVLAVLVLATVLALVWRADIFSRVLFAFSALGSAFGPILLVRLVGRELSALGTGLAVAAGFGLTILISLLPITPGDVAERLLPFIVAMTVAVATSSPRPDQTTA